LLRERAVGESLWEAVLPEELRELPPELRKVDEILDEDRFLAPFRRRLTATIGRPTIAIESYLRPMYLKYRYDLGYETLCREVADSLSWRRFCRIALDGRVPDPSTLMKLTRRLGPELVEELNGELLALAVERKLLRSHRLRVDTTVNSETRYPTDSGLCAHAVSRVTRLGKRIQGAGLAGSSRLRDRRRSVGKRVRRISAALNRGGRTRATVDRLTGEIAARAKQTVREGRTLADAARRALAGGPRSGIALVAQLERELAAAEQVLAQTDRRLAGERTIPDRRISLVDPDARPIRRGSPRKPTEFGYKARVADTAEGFVIVEVPELGNPPDDVLLEGAVATARAAGMQVRTVLADRGFATAVAEAALARQRVTDAIIPSRARPAPVEQTRAWRRRYRFRNGVEGRISQLKRKGLARTRLRGHAGAQTWVGGVALSHNLQRIALAG
jgi:IS5 family transposase